MDGFSAPDPEFVKNFAHYIAKGPGFITIHFPLVPRGAVAPPTGGLDGG
jgi:hypothetical protein